MTAGGRRFDAREMELLVTGHHCVVSLAEISATHPAGRHSVTVPHDDTTLGWRHRRSTPMSVHASSPARRDAPRMACHDDLGRWGGGQRVVLAMRVGVWESRVVPGVLYAVAAMVRSVAWLVVTHAVPVADSPVIVLMVVVREAG